jgi:hypothetical protein
VGWLLTAERLQLQAQIATDLYQTFQYDEAATITARLIEQEGTPAPALRVLYMLEATIYECRGDTVSALQRYEVGGRPS